MMRGLKRWSGQAQAHTAGRRGLTGPRRRWTTVAALAVAAALLALMGGAATAWAQADPIKIGVLHDGSGPLRTYGQQQVRGLKLGIEYATGGTFAVLGRPIQLIIEDDASDPQRAVQAVRKLLELDRVDIVQGTSSSGAALAVIPEIERHRKIFVVDPAAADSITGANFSRYVFRTGRNVSQDALTGAAYLVSQGRRRFMNLAPDYAFGHDSAAAWSRVIIQNGGEMIGDIFAPQDTRDFTPYLQRLLAARPDGVVVTWAGAGAVTLFQQIAEMGLYERMVVFTGIGDMAALRAMGTESGGLVGVLTYYYELPNNPINDWLVRRHFEEYGEPPDLFTAGGMAAGIAIVEAIRKAGTTDAEALIQVMEGMSFDGPKGRYTFRPEDHQALQPLYVARLEIKPGYDYPVPVLVQEFAPEETAPPIMVPNR
ncbi:MAG: substrate-binding domain-containing protein [Bacillota bacterium]